MQEQQIREKQSIKYLGIFIDSHLNWKSPILELSKKISRQGVSQDSIVVVQNNFVGVATNLKHNTAV
jgi:hypothetical protein